MSDIGFSIVIPLYNKEKTIQSTLESALRQSHANLEVIVVDDGSTDRSAAIVQEFTDKRIRLLRQENQGVSAARNHGIREAQFNWIVLLDADDLLPQDALLHYAHAMAERPEADMIVGDSEMNSQRQAHWTTRTIRIRNAFKTWFMKRGLCMLSTQMAYRKDLLLNHPFNVCLSRSEDTELLFRLFRAAHMARTGHVTLRYRAEYTQGSAIAKRITQDFRGHLDFKNAQSLWEKICLYSIYVWAKTEYPQEAPSCYPGMDKLSFLKVAYWTAFWLRALLRTIK